MAVSSVAGSAGSVTPPPPPSLGVRWGDVKHFTYSGEVRVESIPIRPVTTSPTIERKTRNLVSGIGSIVFDERTGLIYGAASGTGTILAIDPITRTAHVARREVYDGSTQLAIDPTREPDTDTDMDSVSSSDEDGSESDRLPPLFALSVSYDVGYGYAPYLYRVTDGGPPRQYIADAATKFVTETIVPGTPHSARVVRPNSEWNADRGAIITDCLAAVPIVVRSSKPKTGDRTVRRAAHLYLAAKDAADGLRIIRIDTSRPLEVNRSGQRSGYLTISTDAAPAQCIAGGGILPASPLLSTFAAPPRAVPALSVRYNGAAIHNIKHDTAALAGPFPHTVLWIAAGSEDGWIDRYSAPFRAFEISRVLMPALVAVCGFTRALAVNLSPLIAAYACDDGPGDGTIARYKLPPKSCPTQLACTPSGHVLFACRHAHALYALTPATGGVARLLGPKPNTGLKPNACPDGSGIGASFVSVRGMCLDVANRVLYVTDDARMNQPLRRVQLPASYFVPPAFPAL